MCMSCTGCSRAAEVTRLCYHCSVRFQKKRQKRLKAELDALEPDDAARLLKGRAPEAIGTDTDVDTDVDVQIDV